MTEVPSSMTTSRVERFQMTGVGDERTVPIEATVIMSVTASSIAAALVSDPRLLADVWGRVGATLSRQKAREIAEMMPDFAGERPIKVLIELLDHLRVSVRAAGIDPDSPARDP